MTSVQEIPPGSGIHGRPVLDDPEVRHLAYHRPDSDRWGYTWCGRVVPKVHHCPPGHDELERPFRPMRNCQNCHDAYRAEQRRRELQRMVRVTRSA